MEGKKTLITNGVIFIAGILSYMGIMIPQDDQTAIALGLTAVINGILRFMTSTPVGQSETETVRIAKQAGRLKK